MKRITSFIIAAVMTFMLLPAAAYAESADGSGEIITASVSVIDETALDAKIEEMEKTIEEQKNTIAKLTREMEVIKDVSGIGK